MMARTRELHPLTKERNLSNGGDGKSLLCSQPRDFKLFSKPQGPAKGLGAVGGCLLFKLPSLLQPPVLLPSALHMRVSGKI